MKNFIFILIFTFGFLGKCCSITSPSPYEAIFNFGDSLSDTGNYLTIHGSKVKFINNLPYGETFGKGTGRFSDGRLILDFIAEAYGLPYLPPYMNVINGRQNIHQGVNFAVGGATALDTEFIERKRQGRPVNTRESLNLQLGWFKNLKPSLCTNEKDCDRFFQKSLFFVGEIGGNDIGMFGHNITELRDIIPLVVEAITNATITLIEEGAVQLVVPGNFPMGCAAGFLTVWRSNITKEYDRRGCLKPYNALVEFQNKQLKLGLNKIKRKYPHARIIYADYYGAAKQFFDAPQKYGFSETLKACCGSSGQGPYNVNIKRNCGSPETTVCKDPSTYANWDGVHFTEAAYRVVAKSIIEGHFSHPPLKPSLIKIA